MVTPTEQRPTAVNEMDARIAAFDWSSTPVGPIDSWPLSLRTAVRIMLDSRYQMFVWWGVDLTNFYNDAYISVLGDRHPWALGRPAHEIWREIWDTLGPQTETVLRGGGATWNQELPLIMERNGYPEETFFTFSYSPIPDDSGVIGGVFCACSEDTDRVISERRLRALRQIAAATVDATSAESACALAATALADYTADVPFALLYLADGASARLAASIGDFADPGLAPATIDLANGGPWRLGAAEPVTLTGLEGLPGGPWPESASTAMILPLARAGQDSRAGYLVLGASPRRPFDDGYLGFFELIAGSVAAAIAKAQAFDDERRRAEALAELDRAKVAFFSNVSHEFRTPLTLMLGPIDEVLGDSGLSGANRDRLLMAQRNSQRLLKLVNTLLDVSRIEAGRIQATFRPTDLATLTADLASTFRAVTDRAGLMLTVDTPPLGEPVYVDPRLWETIVLNLLSNAFKFTLEGEITVSLRRQGDSVLLTVRDSGVGIPASEIPHLFERFHRVEHSQGRSFEGSGIGLALVQDLVRQHGGTISVDSTPGVGSSFTVALPLGRDHLPADRVHADPAVASVNRAEGYVAEALRWTTGDSAIDESVVFNETDAEDALPVVAGPRIVIADDNADIRAYLRRLLGRQYTLELVGDGAAALAAMQRNRPDLLITDVMMPGMDGVELVRRIRDDDGLRGLPVLVLSARAGEEARVEGLAIGADDYVIKPFNGRELTARIASMLKLARTRSDLLDREAAATDRAQRLQRITADLSVATSAEAVGTAVLLAGRQAIGASAGGVVLLDDAGTTLSLLAADALPEDSLNGWRAFSADPVFPFGRSIAQRAPELIGSLDDWRTRYPDLAPQMAALGLEAFASIPLIVDDHVLGAIGWNFDVPKTFSDSDIGYMEAVARQCAQALDRIRLDAALVEERARLAAVLDHLPAAVVFADAATGQTLYGNALVESILGRPLQSSGSRAPIPGVRADGTIVQADAWPLGRALRGETVEAEEIRFQRPDGSWHWMRASAVPVRDAAGGMTGAVAIFADIDREKQAETDLADREALLSVAVESASLGIWAIDGDRITIDDRGHALLGLPAGAQLTFDAWIALVHPDDREAATAAFAPLRDPASNGQYSAEYRVIHPSGEVRWLRGSGQISFAGDGSGDRVVQAVGTLVDETELQRDRRRIAILAEASRTFTEAQFDEQALFNGLARLLSEAFSDAAIVLAVRDDQLRAVAVAHPDPAFQAVLARVYDQPIAHGGGASARALATRKPVLMRDVDPAIYTDDRRPERSEYLTTTPPRSVIAVPIVTDDEVTGVVACVRHTTIGFDDGHLNLVEDIVLRAAAALANARLYWEARQAEELARQNANRLGVLAAASTTFGAMGSTPGLLQAIASELVRVVGDSCSVFVVSDDGQWLQPLGVAHADPEAFKLMVRTTPDNRIRTDQNIAGRVFSTGEPLFVPVVDLAALNAQFLPEHRPYLDRFGIGSLIGVPLWRQGDLAGAIVLTRVRGGAPYSREDLSLVQQLAARAGLALDNAALNEALRTSEERYRLLFDRNPLPAFLFDPETRVIFDVNEAACRIYGYQREEFLALPISVVRPEEDTAAIRAYLAAVQRGDRVEEQVWRHRTRDGQTLDVEIDWTDVVIDSRRRRLAVVNDVTSRLAAERAADRLLEEQLARETAEERIRDRDQFLSIAAHELRTPVAGVRGYAELIQRTADRAPIDTNRLQRHVQAILDGTDRLTRLTNDLLNVARLRRSAPAWKMTTVAFDDLVRRAVAAVGDFASVPISLTIATGDYQVSGDASRLEQVVSNLVENAAKYSAGTPVAVRLWRDGVMTLEVRDGGIGIPPADRDRIFEPFGRGGNAVAQHYNGLGLGLYICRQIVEGHSGEISVDSPGENQGTTVTVRLPARTE